MTMKKFVSFLSSSVLSCILISGWVSFLGILAFPGMPSEKLQAEDLSAESMTVKNAVLSSASDANTTVNVSALARTKAEILYGKGVQAYLDADYVLSISLLNQSFQNNPNDPRPLFFRGLAELAQGNQNAADTSFQQAARLSKTPSGSQFNIYNALEDIVGAPRLLIQNALDDADAEWKQQLRERQIQIYGETLKREKAILARQIEYQQADMYSSVVENATDSSEQKTSIAVSIPFEIPPIDPFRQIETPEDNEDDTDAKPSFFANIMTEKVYTDSERKRLEQLGSRVVYANPMDRPAADGSPFVDIFDDSQVFEDGTKFFDPEDPDDTENTEAVSDILGGGLGEGLGGLLSPGGFLPSLFGGSAEEKTLVEDSELDDSADLFGTDVPAEEISAEMLNNETVVPADDENDFDFFKNDRDFVPSEAPALPEGLDISGGLGGLEDLNNTEEPENTEGQEDAVLEDDDPF